uniref:Uncharacterized protein n=2 Tax=Anguilla anguilla TaxID=7936 RepID=A0A0E9R7F2_ANGAN
MKFFPEKGHTEENTDSTRYLMRKKILRARNGKMSPGDLSRSSGFWLTSSKNVYITCIALTTPENCYLNGWSCILYGALRHVEHDIP